MNEKIGDNKLGAQPLYPISRFKPSAKPGPEVKTPQPTQDSLALTGTSLKQPFPPKIPPVKTENSPNAQPVSKPWEMKEVDPLALTRVDEVRKDYGFTGKGITVAVIDSGFNHPQTELAAWKDIAANAPQPIDEFGHGTHDAGAVNLVAPGAKIAAVKVGDSQGKAKDSDVIKGIQWAVENRQKYNIKVLNISLQLDHRPDLKKNPVDLAVEAAVKAGITVVAAAGNRGPNPETITVPGENPQVITVGSLLDKNTISNFSSRGPAVTGFVPPDASNPYPRQLVGKDPKPDVLAPGEYIASWMAPDSKMAQDAQDAEKIRALNGKQLKEYFEKNPKKLSKYKVSKCILNFSDEKRENRVKSKLLRLFIPQEGWLATDGTSISAPLVAGIAALLLEAKPNLSPEEIKELLISTAQDLTITNDIYAKGHGLVDAKAAVDKLLKKRRP